MANDVINPFQLFRDDRGKALSSGYLRVLVNRTTTVGTAFSDSDLTTPQTVDPYQLDAYGRVRGDLRWSGERTIELYDANLAFVRRLDDVVSAVDTSGFAINFASVAAMVADTSLEAGDVAETQSYNAGQDQGGARYIIQATSETEDLYTIIDLDNGLQAALLDLESANTFFHAGAIGDGNEDDTGPVQALLSRGGDIRCENGSFRCSSLTLSASARIHGNGTLIHQQFVTSSMLTLSGADLFIWFDGIVLDGDSDNQSATSTAISIESNITATGTNVSVVSFTNVTFQNGAEYDLELNGADDGTNVLFTFGTCRFLGGLQADGQSFLPAYVAMADGVNAVFESCYFDLESTPAATGGRAGVINSNSTFVNPGFLRVLDTTFNAIGAYSSDAVRAGAIQGVELGILAVQGCTFISPHTAAVAFGSEVSGVQIMDNLIDGFIGSNPYGHIASIAQVTLAAGENWQIANNQSTGAPSNGAIVLDGSGLSSDASSVDVSANMIDGSAGPAVLMQSLTDIDVAENSINMESAVGINAIEVNANGVDGNVRFGANLIQNVDGSAIQASATSTAKYVVDGNTIEGVTTGPAIDIQDSDSAVIKNNALNECADALINVDTLDECRIDCNDYIGTDPTDWITGNTAITDIIVGENGFEDLGAAITDEVAAATVNVNCHFMRFTGTAAPTTLNMPSAPAGFIVVLFSQSGTQTFTEAGGNMNLGAATRPITTGQTLTMVSNGQGAWAEIGYSLN